MRILVDRLILYLLGNVNVFDCVDSDDDRLGLSFISESIDGTTLSSTLEIATHFCGTQLCEYIACKKM
jgi:hypothetical protein